MYKKRYDMINMKKYGVNIKNSERPKYSKRKAVLKKRDHHKSFWYKNFKDHINFQHAHGGRTDMKRS